MKTLVQQASRVFLFTACAGLGFTQAARAQSSVHRQPVCVDRVADCTYLVRVSNPDLQHGELKVIRLQDNAILYDQYTTKSVFGSKLNMRDLPDGAYAFVVKIGKEVTRYTLDINTRTERSESLGSVSLIAVAKR